MTCFSQPTTFLSPFETSVGAFDIGADVVGVDADADVAEAAYMWSLVLVSVAESEWARSFLLIELRLATTCGVKPAIFLLVLWKLRGVHIKYRHGLHLINKEIYS